MSLQSLPLPLPLPKALEPWLTLNMELRVILCHRVGCQHALNPRVIDAHLRDHHSAPLEVRQQVTEYLKQWQWQYDFNTIQLPLDNSLPLPVLPLLDGFRCKICSHKSTNQDVIRKHCSSQHKQKQSSKQPLFKAAQLQSWFKGKRARYWVVDATRRDVNNGLHNQGSGNGSGGSSDDRATIRAEIEAWKAEEEGQYQPTTVPAEVSKWLLHTRWEAVLAQSQLSLAQAAAFNATATAPEPQLERLLDCWEQIFQRCLNTLVAVADYKDILQWWQSPKQEEASPRPFELPLSFLQYNMTFRSCLGYIFRAAPTESSKAGPTSMVFSAEQWMAWTKIQELLAVAVAEGEAEEASQKKTSPKKTAGPKNAADSEKSPDHKLTTALMGFLVALLAQDLSQLSQYHSPIMHFLAINSIHPIEHRFATAQDYTPILARMLWIIRLVMLEIAVSEEGWPELGLQSRCEIGAVARAVAERVHRLRKSFLCQGSFSPASSILSQLAYGKKLNQSTPAESNIHWADDHQVVFYSGKGVSMARVKSMCQELVVELEGLLHGLFFRQAVPPLPLAQLVDSMGSAPQFRQRGYSFLDHPDNARWKVDWEWMWERMVLAGDEERLVTKNSSGNGSGQWQWVDQRCKAYLAREKQFLLKLLVLMHFTGGMPGRSPEIGSIKVQNSATSNRNLFIINGRVAVAMTYDKAQRLRAKTQYTFRCFPDQLSQVIVQYLSYLRPFTQAMAKSRSEFLFADQRGPWIHNQLSQGVAVATTKHLGVRLTVASWRQVVIAIGDEHLRRASRVWKQADEDEDKDEAVAMAMAEGDDNELEQSRFEQILVRQAAHTKRTADLQYAINGAFLSRLGPDLVHAYSQASRAWHAFLGLESTGGAARTTTGGEAAGTGIKTGEGAAVAVAAAVKRPGSPLQPETKRVKLEGSPGLQGLQKLLGPDAQPRSDSQAEALELVHAATPAQPQIIVLGTGSGKSFLFFSVAALLTHQTVVVVVPFAALVDDLVQRARTHQLTCEEWQWQEQWQSPGQTLPQLLIVSANRAIEDSFLHFAKGLELRKQLAHVFFDECHVAVTDTSYRAKLRELWQLRYLRCRFTCLTATLMPVLEPVLQANLLLQNAQVYRQLTMRSTIQYRVIECSGPLWKAAEPVIRQLPLPPGGRGIIYVRSYAQGEQVAKAIGCPFYKATSTNKEAILRQWRGNGSGSGSHNHYQNNSHSSRSSTSSTDTSSSTSRTNCRSNSSGWIVATGALGTGINIPKIFHIVHLGRPYGLTSFMQQAGRGGRAGEISTSIVFVSGNGSGSFPAPQQDLLSAYSVEEQDEEALTEFLESSGCRRTVLARHMDGQEGDCTTTDSIPCDRCSSSSGSGSGSSNNFSAIVEDLIYQHLRARIEQDEQLERFHQHLQQRCVYCWLMRGGAELNHRYQGCPHAYTQQCEFDAYQQWRRQLQLAPKHQCFRCGLTQDICTAIDDQAACTYPHQLLPVFFFLARAQALHSICAEVGFRGSEPRQWQWLNRLSETRPGRWELNWMRVWRWIGKGLMQKGNDNSSGSGSFQE